MKQGIGGNHFVPIAEPSLLIESHPELPVAIYSPHDGIKHHGEKFQSVLPAEIEERRDIHVGGNVVTRLDLPVIVIEMRASLPPLLPINNMKYRTHIFRCLTIYPVSVTRRSRPPLRNGHSGKANDNCPAVVRHLCRGTSVLRTRSGVISAIHAPAGTPPQVTK